ncbi:MAG: PEP-CTERM sorting domain-containing protein [Pseudomonadota bacterium]|nr:PEP-CTERM sorting domain-containing protein [Pseudomonadota bacterium]
MKKIFTLTALAAAAALAAGNANAVAVAFASNQITNFMVVPSPSGSVKPFSGTDTSEANASYAGVASPTGGSVSAPLFAAADKTQATAGPGPFPGENNYTFLAGTALGMNGSRGDSNLSTATFNSTTGAATTPNINDVAEARVASANIAASGGRITGVSVVDVLQGATITISFTDAYRYYANTDFLNENANASIANTFEVRSASNTVVSSFAPTALNASCGSNSSFPRPCDSGAQSSAFSFTTVALAAGRYTLDFRTTSQVDVASPVPEPETYALFLAGLGAIGFIGRRRRLSK